jgi:hypothetical protein
MVQSILQYSHHNTGIQSIAQLIDSISTAPYFT